MPTAGATGSSRTDAIGRLTGLIDDIRPDTVLTFGPDGVTGHQDHRSVSVWATAAVKRAHPTVSPRLLYSAKTEAWCDRFDPVNRMLRIFPPGLPPRLPVEDIAFEVVLPDDLLDRKVAALLAQTSQVAPLVDAVGEEDFRHWVATECFRPAFLNPT